MSWPHFGRKRIKLDIKKKEKKTFSLEQHVDISLTSNWPNKIYKIKHFLTVFKLLQNFAEVNL